MKLESDSNGKITCLTRIFQDYFSNNKITKFFRVLNKGRQTLNFAGSLLTFEECSP